MTFSDYLDKTDIKFHGFTVNVMYELDYAMENLEQIEK